MLSRNLTKPSWPKFSQRARTPNWRKKKKKKKKQKKKIRKKWKKKKKRQRSKEQSPGAYQRAHRRRLERWKVSVLTRQRKRKQKRFPARGTPDHYTESVLSDCIAGIQSIFRCIPTRLQNREAGDPDWILDAHGGPYRE